MRGRGRARARSLIAGGLLGVAKNLNRLVVMKINPTVGLMLEGLGKIDLELQNRNEQKPPSKGRVVARIPGTFA